MVKAPLNMDVPSQALIDSVVDSNHDVCDDCSWIWVEVSAETHVQDCSEEFFIHGLGL